MIRKSVAFTLLLLTLLPCFSSPVQEKTYLKDKDWEPGVRENLDALIGEYGNKGNYAVFDFDNTTCIFDIMEQYMVYQIETMSFAIKPSELNDILLTGLPYDKAYTAMAYDISEAYSDLYKKYGPFDAEGISEKAQAEIKNEKSFKEFSTKLRCMYNLIGSRESTAVSYPWILFLNTGKTADELYGSALKSHKKYSAIDTETETWTTDGIGSMAGAAETTFVCGIHVSDSIKELFRVLTWNGIDVWICSASQIGVVCAAVDCFGLHDYCAGVIGMTLKTVGGKMINECDFENGFGAVAKENGTWEQMKLPIMVQPHKEGKTKAICNTLYKQYGNKGPVACFMDSTGDFNLCTEFADTKLVVCFNRADRKLTDGGGLIACLAVYQKDVLRYNLEKAEANGDTLYLLQGRDENGTASLRPSNSTIKIGETEETLFGDDNILKTLGYFKQNNLTTADILNTFAVKSPEESALGFEYGFLDSYRGYHSIH